MLFIRTLHDFACHPCAGAMLIFSVLYRSNFSLCTTEVVQYIVDKLILLCIIMAVAFKFET
jgi:hypothetical protein